MFPHKRIFGTLVILCIIFFIIHFDKFESKTKNVPEMNKFYLKQANVYIIFLLIK